MMIDVSRNYSLLDRISPKQFARQQDYMLAYFDYAFVEERGNGRDLHSLATFKMNSFRVAFADRVRFDKDWLRQRRWVATHREPIAHAPL
jgi:hypothetical protein